MELKRNRRDIISVREDSVLGETLYRALDSIVRLKLQVPMLIPIYKSRVMIGVIRIQTMRCVTYSINALHFIICAGQFAI